MRRPSPLVSLLPLLALLMIAPAAAHSGEWAGTQYQEPYAHTAPAESMPVDLDALDEDAFADGFVAGFCAGVRDDAYRHTFDERRDAILDHPERHLHSEQTYVTAQATLRVAVSGGHDRIGVSYRLGDALGYFEGYHGRRHRDYRRYSPWKARQDPLYDGRDVELDARDCAPERGTVHGAPHPVPYATAVVHRLPSKGVPATSNVQYARAPAAYASWPYPFPHGRTTYYAAPRADWLPCTRAAHPPYPGFRSY